MTHSAISHRFGWLNSVAGKPLPIETLDDPLAAWEAAADAQGLDMDGLTKLVAETFRLGVADFRKEAPGTEALIPVDLARRYLVVPLDQQARTLRVATCDPASPDLVQQLEFNSGRDVMVEVASPASILAAIESMDPGGLDLGTEWTTVGDDTEETDQAETERQLKLSAESPAILDLLITRGIALGASDIHVQSNGHAGTVRYRVDGVLQAGPHLSLDGLASVLGRAKAVGGMDPSVRIRPQDGRGAIKVGHTVYDLRFSTLPSSGSESLVVRLLAQGGLLALESYGADPHSVTRLRQGFLDQTSGIFIVTGPTGSGKTTLLYSLLGELNDGRRHIHTVEDPVEIQLEGLAQVQINRRAGLTFEAAIRSLMRQDPDVILVSETRDPETARAVTDAAMTGHLVSTTLHTIDAATALPRLRDLKVDPRELAQVLSGISAQRLLRTLCTECREPVTDAAGPMEEWFADLAGFLPAYRSVGCDKCDSSGYSGRFPAVEVLLTDDDLVEAFMQGASHHQLRHIAQLGGMRTMGEIVADRARQGDTDVAEIRRVMGSDLLTADTIRRPETSATYAPPDRVDGPVPSDHSSLAQSDVLLISSDTRSRVIVEDGLHSVGLTLHMEEDIPAAAVWTEMHNPRLVILDVQHEGEGAVRRLREARDAFLALLPHMFVIVLAPADDAPLERILLEHGLGDYLRAPLTPAHIGFLTDQVLRRAEVRAGAYA